MRNIIQDSIQQVTQSPKAAAIISWITTTLGVFFAWIPANIGNVATVMGICLSAVLIYTHIKKSHREDALHEIEMKIKRKELNK